MCSVTAVQLTGGNMLIQQFSFSPELMICMTALKLWTDVSFSPAGLSGVDVSGIGVVQEIQTLPLYSDESKLN